MTESSFFCGTCKSPLPRFTNIPCSPTPHLFGTNGVPSEAESQEIRESIAAVQANISQLDVDITRARRVVERLLKEREALNEYASEHAVFLTPARRLPAEIWSEIFSHCLPECRVDDMGLRSHSWTFSPRYPPEVFLQVCNDWKSIALSSPRLWSSIHLYRSSRVPPTNMIENWLMRSHPTPLNVILELDEEMITCSDASTVLQQSHRWRSASISIPIYSWSPFSLLKNNMPELEELHIAFESDTLGTLPPPPHILVQIDFLSNAPKLRRVALGKAPSYNIADVKLPWAQLTHFSSPNYLSSYNQLAALLQSAPELLEVELSLAWGVQMTYHPVQHSHLHNLSLHILQGDAGSVFEHLSLPSLRMLSIEASDSDWFWTSSPFESFMLHNGPSLDRFKVTSLTVVGLEVVACLTALPSLRHFSLVTFQDAQYPLQEILKALYWPTAEIAGVHPVVLPAMKSIELDCFVRCDSMIVNMFLDMVESRWTPSHSDISCMESATLLLRSWSSQISPEDSDRIRRLKSEGLALEVVGMYNLN
jgi:hypothetical protein